MKKKLLTLIVLFISLFTLQVNAKQFYAGEKLEIKEQKEHSVFAAGTEIDISSFIDGASFIAGEEITISSSQDIIFAAGKEIKVTDAYAKDAFLSSKDIEISNSQIRDLYAFGEKIKINSEISRNANLAGTKVVIDSKIMGDVNIAAQEIIIKDEAYIGGTLRYPEHAYIKISQDAVVEKTKTYVSTPDETTSQIVATRVQDFIISYVSVAIIGLLLLWLFTNKFTNIEKEEFTVKNIAAKTGLGFLVLIGTPIASIIAMISIIGFPIGLIMILLYGILIYLSIIPSGYFLGHHLLKDKIKKKENILILGVLLIKLLELIPFVGGFVVFISLCFGMWTALGITKKKATKEK